MRTIYLRKEYNGNIRKVLIDMAYLVTHNKIRLPKTYYEDSLYLPFHRDKDNNQPDKYFLTKDKIISEDADHYYFKFPFKPEQIEDAAL